MEGGRAVRWLCRTGLLLGLCAVPAWSQSQPSTRAYVLDAGARTLVAVDLATGQRHATQSLDGRPEVLLRSPDGSRLVVLDRGPGEDAHERGYKATGKSVATVVDPAAMAVVGRVELGWGLQQSRWFFGPDSSRLTLLCPGFEAKVPAEALRRELVSIDVGAAREAGRIALEPGAFPVRSGQEGGTLVVIQGLPHEAKFPYPQSRLWLVDLVGPSVAATLDAGSWNDLHKTGAYFYLLAHGKPDKSAEKNRNGSVEVVSLEHHALEATLDAGRGPLGLYAQEAGQVLIPSEGPLGGSEGELRVLRAGALVATLKVASAPRMVASNRDTVFVVGEKAVTVVDLERLQVTATIALAKGTKPLVEGSDVPTELRVSPDGRHAFILYGERFGPTQKVAVLDLETREAVGSTKTGRGGKKFVRSLERGMANGPGGFLYALSDPSLYLGPGSGPGMLAVRPDGRYAYALNRDTDDVTVVDATTGEAVETIASGGSELELLSGGRAIAVLSRRGIGVLDTSNNTKSADLELPGLRWFGQSPDGALAVGLADKTVVVLDGATGKVLQRLDGFISPIAIAFDGPRGRP